MAKIKLSDYIAKTLASCADVSDTCFLVSGGGNMHLIDSIARHLKYICNHHEGASSFAAEGYARASGRTGLACVTTGPGGTNALTGVYSAFVDSQPILVLSGQVKRSTTIAAAPSLNLRQLGDQEVDIISLAKPICKYAISITNPQDIAYHLERALYEARSARPGPVWLDIPHDVQSAIIDEDSLVGFSVPSIPASNLHIKDVITAFKTAKRPVIIAGNGIALAGAVDEFKSLAYKLNVPVLSTFARYDIFRDDERLSFGRFGSVGQRAANFIIQNADMILSIGARLNIRAISYAYDLFAPNAYKIGVDIDPAELSKPTVKFDLAINADAKEFISALDMALAGIKLDTQKWLNRCDKFKQDFSPIEAFRYEKQSPIDSYRFFDLLAKIASDDAIFVLGNGTACVSAYSALKLRKRQKVIVNSGCASMGYDLPAAIGAKAANLAQQVICVTGEGSLQMNLAELATIAHYGLDIKLFVLNNDGYASIKNTQNSFFNGRLVGADPSSGVFCPPSVKIANVYGLDGVSLYSHDGLEDRLSRILSLNGPYVCEIVLSPNEIVAPKLASKMDENGVMQTPQLADMYPFLDRDTLARNLIKEDE